MKRITIQLTSYRGQCVNATHYYVSVNYWNNGDYHSKKLTRPISRKEIDSDQDRFYAYEEGMPTKCFLTWQQALESAKQYIEDNKISGDVFVDGVPNHGTMLLEQALSPELDTRPKCSECGKIFEAGEGFYNYPSGALCVKCNEKQ